VSDRYCAVLVVPYESAYGDYESGRRDRRAAACSVPVPAFVLDELSVLCKDKALGDLVFSVRDGRYLPRPKSATGWFQAAVRKAKVQKITPHDLRHTCASLAVAAG
jgi:site-specific recombinase XerD